MPTPVITHFCWDHVVVEIAGSGQDIPQNAQPRTFEPFSTTKVVGKDTGLGRHITYGYRD
jgi:two-component system, cell cycle sensor histidine kinase and response regulator CckA